MLNVNERTSIMPNRHACEGSTCSGRDGRSRMLRSTSKKLAGRCSLHSVHVFGSLWGLWPALDRLKLICLQLHVGFRSCTCIITS